MLTFLGKIRRSLIKSGSTQKYLLYALGEIALVVIGILFALQINNWNESRKDRITEEEILMGIQTNIESNINKLTNFRTFLGQLNSSSEIVISMLDGSTEYHDSIINHLNFSLRQFSNSQRTLSVVGYQALSNEGFDIIRNSSLKNEIIKLFEESYLDLENAIARTGQTYSSVIEFQHEYFRRLPDSRLVPLNKNFIVGDDRVSNWVRYIMTGRAYVDGFINESLNESLYVLNLIRNELGHD